MKMSGLDCPLVHWCCTFTLQAALQDSEDEEEQLRVQKQAQSLLDCAADLLRSEGLMSTRAMLHGLHFKPQDASPHKGSSATTWPLAGHMPTSPGQGETLTPSECVMLGCMLASTLAGPASSEVPQARVIEVPAFDRFPG